MAIIVETPLEVQSTPFKLDMGQHSWMGIEPNKPSNVEAADAFSQRTSQIQEEAKATLEHVVNEMKHCYTQSWQDAPKYKEGDMVWLNLQNNTTRCPIKEARPQVVRPLQGCQGHLSCSCQAQPH